MDLTARRRAVARVATPARVALGFVLVGLLVVALGVGLIFAPAGIIAAGLALTLVGAVGIQVSEPRR